MISVSENFGENLVEIGPTDPELHWLNKKKRRNRTKT